MFFFGIFSLVSHVNTTNKKWSLLELFKELQQPRYEWPKTDTNKYNNWLDHCYKANRIYISGSFLSQMILNLTKDLHSPLMCRSVPKFLPSGKQKKIQMKTKVPIQLGKICTKFHIKEKKDLIGKNALNLRDNSPICPRPFKAAEVKPVKTALI